MRRITITSVFVDDQAKALAFYTGVLGLVRKHDVPLGTDRWLTVVSADDPDGPELLLEPSGHPAVGQYRAALVADGILLAQFTVPDVRSEHRRLSNLGVRFLQQPTNVGPVTMVVLDDTCGNLVQLVSPNEPGAAG